MIPNNLSTLTDHFFDNLDDTERQVIKLRFGIPNGSVLTLSEVSKHLGIDSDAVRKIELRAMSKLGWLQQ